MWQILLDSHSFNSYFTLTYHFDKLLYCLSKFTLDQKKLMSNPPMLSYSTMHSSAGHTETMYHYTLPCVKVSFSAIQSTYNTVHKSLKHWRHVTHALVLDSMGIQSRNCDESSNVVSLNRPAAITLEGQFCGSKILQNILDQCRPG